MMQWFSKLKRIYLRAVEVRKEHYDVKPAMRLIKEFIKENWTEEFEGKFYERRIWRAGQLHIAHCRYNRGDVIYVNFNRQQIAAWADSHQYSFLGMGDIKYNLFFTLDLVKANLALYNKPPSTHKES